MAQKIGHSLIVTVVPVARSKIKPFLAGTVKPLIVIVVHLTALATSVNVRIIYRAIPTTTLAYLTKN